MPTSVGKYASSLSPMHYRFVAIGSLIFILYSRVDCFLHYRSHTRAKMSANHSEAKIPTNTAPKNDKITILGFGSLLSEKSSRLTFPELSNFRLGRIPHYRRVFGHPAEIFFQRGIANLETLEISSLSAEYDEGNKGFVCSVFEVENDGMMEGGIPSMAFLKREEEFDIATVPFVDNGTPSEGILCRRSSDEAYIERWGQEHFNKQYGQYGVSTIWGWERNSGLRPCAVYLRHCVLAAKSMGTECYQSFLDETFLVDRKTTIRDYLDQFPDIMNTQPPPDLTDRYGG